MLRLSGTIAFFSMLTGPLALADPELEASKTHENVIYGMHGGLALLMDVYQPGDANGYALLFINGCGWHSPVSYDGFSLKDYDKTPRRVRPLVELGFTVFVINHRTAPLFRYPVAVEDAQRAVRFIRHHRQKYGVTSDEIAAVGHSSGGHLALTLALRSAEAVESAKDPVEGELAGVNVVVSMAGPTDLSADGWSPWASQVVASFMGDMRDYPAWPDADPGVYREASPIAYVDADDPPVLLVHGTKDPIVPVTQARALTSTLKKHDVAVEYWEVEGGGHSVEEMLSGPAADPEAPSMENVGRWLLERLQAKKGK